MRKEYRERHAGPPSALRYMLRALLPRRGWRRGQRFPAYSLCWDRFGVDTPAATAAIVLPHLYGFRLTMAMLTQPDWPIPAWGTLQVRNRLVLHQPFALAARGTLELRVCGWRVLERGVEVDLHTRLTQGAVCAWESIVSYYARGRFGPQETCGAEAGAPRESPVIDLDSAPSARWVTETNQRWRHAGWTGDYNGLHQWDWYARRHGFGRAFAHPQRIAIQCLIHMAQRVRGPQQLDLWLKGPVPYGAAVALREQPLAGTAGANFNLVVGGSSRPALVGRWRALDAAAA